MQDVGSRGVVATAHAPAGQLHLNILFEAHPGMIGDLEAAIWSGMSPHDCAQELREHFKASVPVRSCSCLVQSLALLPTRCTPSTMAGYCMRDFGHGHCSIHAKGYTSVELQHCREDFRIRNGRYLHNQRRRVRTTPHLSVAFGIDVLAALGPDGLLHPRGAAVGRHCGGGGCGSAYGGGGGGGGGGCGGACGA